MPSLWRISPYLDLNGVGGLKASNRWNTRGRRVVYLAQTVAGAVLERLVHLMDDSQVPLRVHLIQVDYPDILGHSEINEPTLLPNWRDNVAATRSVGDSWLQLGRSALLRVPSVVTPYSSNFLLNPDHADAALVKIQKAIDFNMEPRLKRLADYALSYRQEVRYVTRDE